MAYCDKCGNFDDSFIEDLEDYEIEEEKKSPDYQPDLYYYWDGDFCEEDYNWRDAEPEAECLCEICFDILNTEGKIKWKDDKNPFKCASTNSGT